MEIDRDAKAPVTRLKRRMSLEQSEESKSPAPNTPSKKRGGRRAVKPDLDLIDENNSADSNTINTINKKTALKDVTDSKVEEKSATPRRRSMRIKSNTSIVSDIASAADSPRAKRATRRTSQIDSDTEAPPTPVRLTRKTRRDSASSIEKIEIQPSSKPTVQITDVILEEPESISRKSSGIPDTDNHEKNTSIGNVRKSPRLKQKIKHNIPTDESNEQLKNTSLNKSLETSTSKEQESKVDKTPELTVPQKNRHSLVTTNLITNLNLESKTNTVNLNKSTSALETQNKGNKKRNRTKSWTTITVSNEKDFYSDNDGLMKKNIDFNKYSTVKLIKLNSGDGLNTGIDKVNKTKSDNNGESFLKEDIDTSMTNVKNKSMDKKNDEHHGPLQLSQNSTDKNNVSETSKLFEIEPSRDIQTIIFIDDDSGTNTPKINMKNKHEQEHEDQCVPVIQQSNQIDKDISQFSIMSQKNDSIKANLSKNSNFGNDSCEPMDVDETIPELKSNNSHSMSPCILLNKSDINEKLTKSQRKSSISNLNRSENNKSTLILSQLKDNSAGDINNVSKSPQIKQSLLSKTTEELNATQENDNNKRNLSLNYVNTSTPLQQKNLLKFGNINTSVITSNNSTNDIKNETLSKNNNKTADDVDSESSSEEEDEEVVHEDVKETSRIKINKKKQESIDSNLSDSSESLESKSDNLMDDEAIDAGDSYESGDSQDESERQYLEENEIIEKGETLTSDNDLSNDSDYEKDSFVVSSAEEDNELLNGTDDDLSLSDNELKMTTKSKKKYDERQKKEQKKASREMYESRHKLNRANKNASLENDIMSNIKKQILSFSESEDEMEIKPKKNKNRMRLDSSHEVSFHEDEDEKKKLDKKKKRTSQISSVENALSEKEISVCNESLKEKDPLTINVKQEPKTPQKGNSSIAFVNAENENELTKTQTEIVDPLEDSLHEDSSLTSDSENIIQNYDSILEGLNKTNKTKSKTCDISLNINKKKDKKKNKGIVDELNLTQVKSIKKKKDDQQIQKAIKTDKKALQDTDSSSDSIDLNLLFSEDSNTSDNIQNKANNITSNKDDFIPLKRIEGKTNLRDNTDDSNENNESFFIDTVGATDQSNSLFNKSSSKKNKKLSFNDGPDSPSQNSDSDGPTDVPFEKEKRTSKIQENQNETDETDLAKDACNRSVTKTPSSGKKNKNKLSDSQIVEPMENILTLNTSLNKKKTKKSIDIVNEISTEKDVKDCVIDQLMTKTPGSKKKKRMSQSKTQEQADDEDVSNDKSYSTPSNISMKKKQLLFSPESNQIEPEELSLLESKSKTPGSQKKKKTSLKPQEHEQPDLTLETSLNTSKIKTPGSQKKKIVKEYEKEDINVTVVSEESIKVDSNSFAGENTSLTKSADSNDNKNSKKRKRKSSHTPAEETVLKDEVNTSKKLNESLVISQKKKRKISQNEETITILEQKSTETQEKADVCENNNFKKEISSGDQNTKGIKRNKRKERDEEYDEGNKISKVPKESSFDSVHIPRLPTSILEQLDDKPRQISNAKKPKLISTTQFSVVEARKRRNKPSNYLEESIYLNDDESENKKQKKVLQKPKVLPFVPTVLTSARGYTTNFKVNVIPTEIKFVAQSSTVSNFKDDFLYNKKIRRQGTYDLYKRKRNIQISKF